MLTRKGLPLPLTEILCRIPVNIPDRLLSVFGGYGFAVMLAWIGGKLRNYSKAAMSKAPSR
jgi:hypothetical protein